MSLSSSPPLNSHHSLLCLRSRNNIKIWEIPSIVNEATLDAGTPKDMVYIGGNISNARWSPDGSYFAVIDQRGITLCQLNSEKRGDYEEFRLPLPSHLENIPTKQLRWFAFSPQGTYLVTMYGSVGHGFVEFEGPNYLVWKVERNNPRGIIANIALMWAERLKNTIAYPGNIRWRDDEKIRYSTIGGQLKLYEGHCFESHCEPFHSIPLRNRYIAEAAAARPEKPHELDIWLFSPASADGRQGELRLEMMLWNPESKKVVERKSAKHCWDKEDTCEFQWSASRERCLLVTSTLVDEAGENYGSVGDVWLCDLLENRRIAQQASNGLGGDFASEEVPLLISKVNRGVVQDAKWSPFREEFAIIQGKSPSEISVKAGIDGQTVCELPRGYRNKLIWSPRGDMLAVGGFGNLAGDLSFYAREQDQNGKLGMKLIADWRESCTVLCEWSPCGNFFFTASVRPRMNVDNQVKLWSRSGTKIAHVKFEELHDVTWKFEKTDLFPALSPPSVSTNARPAEEGATAAANVLSKFAAATSFRGAGAGIDGLSGESKNGEGVTKRGVMPSVAGKKSNAYAGAQGGQQPSGDKKASWRNSTTTMTNSDSASAKASDPMLPMRPKSEVTTSQQPSSLQPVSSQQKKSKAPSSNVAATAVHPAAKPSPAIPSAGTVGKKEKKKFAVEQQPIVLGANNLYIPSNSAISTSTSTTSPPTLSSTSLSRSTETARTQVQPSPVSQSHAERATDSHPDPPTTRNEAPVDVLKFSNQLDTAIQGTPTTAPGPQSARGIRIESPRMSPGNESAASAVPPAGGTDRPGSGGLLSLLQSILPSHARVRIEQPEEEVPRCDSPARELAPVAWSGGEGAAQCSDQERQHFIQLMSQAGLLPPTTAGVSRDAQTPGRVQSANENNVSGQSTRRRGMDLQLKNSQHPVESSDDGTRSKPLEDLLSQLCHRAAAVNKSLRAQQQHSSGRETSLDPPARGEEVAQESPRAWQYVDPEGLVQGPFSEEQMKSWWDRGYFSGLLPIRWHEGQPFRPLQEVFPKIAEVFSRS